MPQASLSPGHEFLSREVLHLTWHDDSADATELGGQTTLERVKAATTELEKLTENEMRETGIPGIAIAVVFKDQAVFAKERRKRATEKRRAEIERKNAEDQVKFKRQLEEIRRDDERRVKEWEELKRKPPSLMTRHERIQVLREYSPEPQFLGSGRTHVGEKTVTYLMSEMWENYMHYGPTFPNVGRGGTLSADEAARAAKWRDDRMREFDTDYFEWTHRDLDISNSGIDTYEATTAWGLSVVTLKTEQFADNNLTDWIMRLYAYPLDSGS